MNYRRIKVNPNSANITNIRRRKIKYQSEKQNIEINNSSKKNSALEILSIVINGIIAITAVIVLCHTQKQTKASIESATAAKDAVTLTRKSLEFNQKTYTETAAESEKISTRSEANYQRSLKISEQSLNSSLKSLELSQKNFETENKPYIFFNALEIDSILPNKPLKITVHFVNSGKSPALFLGLKKNIQIDKENVIRVFKYDANRIMQLNHFQQPNTVYRDLSFTEFTLTNSAIKLFRENKLFIFYYGEVLYKNVMNNKLAIYKFCFNIKPDGRFNITRTHNEVIEDVDPSVFNEFN